MRGQALEVIQQPVTGEYCDGCTYQHTGVRRVLPDGTGNNGVCLVGDSPWIEEVAAGRNFTGASGRWLDSILTKRGLDRNDFLVTNSSWCKPPSLGLNDEPEKSPEAQMALRQCRPYLDNLIAERKPKVLVPLGNVALHRLTGFTNIEANHSYLLPTEYGIPAVPTFHPSGIIQGNWNLTIAWILAIARALEVASNEFKPTQVKVIEDPDPSYIQYPANGDIPIPVMCDIETPKSLAGRNEEEAEDDPSYQIIRMGFSVRAWEGVSFPYEGDYIRRAKELIRRSRYLIFWNKNYDLPRLKSNGFNFHPGVTIIDAMWAWHFLYSDLPKALAFAAPFFYSGPPWKHLASQRPAYYNAMDNAIQMGVYLATKSHLEKEGRWDRFWNHCVRVDPIYVRMGAKGVKVDTEARVPFMQALEKDAKAELVKVQELLPPKLVKVQESFKKLNPPTAAAIHSKSVAKRLINSLVRIEMGETLATTKDGSHVATEGGGLLKRPIYRRVSPFNPGSRPDLLALMKELGVKPPKARGEDRDSVEAKYLKRLTKHPIFRHCVNYKQRVKLVSTYNWPLDAQDRAHTTYGFHPSTWRSSSRNVNLGNIPKRFELAKLFRRLLIAESGHKLIEIDRCVAPETKVLKSDLTWIRADEVQIGDELIGFDETLGGGHSHSFRPSTVVRTALLTQARVKVHTTQGDIIVAEDHPFAARYKSYKRRWIKASKLRPGCQIGFLSKPWRFDESRDGGYLSGFLDGEGWCSQTRLGFGQKEGPTWNRVLSLMAQRGFVFSSHLAQREGTPVLGYIRNGNVMQAATYSMVGAMEIIGTLRPPRLLAKSRRLWENRRTWGKRTLIAEVISVERLEHGPTVAIETSTGTYISEGFFSHNSGLEAVLVGYWAKSLAYINLAKAGPHSYLGSYILGTPVPYELPFPELKKALKEIKKAATVDQYEGWKRCVHGSTYLLSPYGLHDEYEEFFPTEYLAQKAQDMFFSTPGGKEVRKYQQATIEEAYSNKYLDNSFQYRHHFWGPMYKFSKKDRRWVVDHEGDAKRAVAYRPQSDGAAIQREDILSLESVTLVNDYLRLPTYDSLVLECPNNLVDKGIEALYNQFSKPIPELSNLEGYDGTIGFEIKVGLNLAEMEEVSL